MAERKRAAYRIPLGKMYHCDAIDLLTSLTDDSVDLICTSAPFALAAPKEYGHQAESKYVEWFMTFANEMHRVLKDSGSFVVDLGGAWLVVRGSRTRDLMAGRDCTPNYTREPWLTPV